MLKTVFNCHFPGTSACLLCALKYIVGMYRTKLSADMITCVPWLGLDGFIDQTVQNQPVTGDGPS
jgi:hypothetical protein